MKKTRKFAEMKRMISAKDARMYVSSQHSSLYMN